MLVFPPLLQGLMMIRGRGLFRQHSLHRESLHGITPVPSPMVDVVCGSVKEQKEAVPRGHASCWAGSWKWHLGMMTFRSSLRF